MDAGRLWPIVDIGLSALWPLASLSRKGKPCGTHFATFALCLLTHCVCKCRIRMRCRRASPGRYFEPVRGEELARGLRAHRLAEHIALRVFAAELIELDRVRIGLRPFRYHLHAEIVRERDDR